MPRRALEVYERGNITTKKDVKRAKCTPGKHANACQNPNPTRVSIPAGCAYEMYWRSRTRFRLAGDSKPVLIEVVASKSATAEPLLKRKLDALEAADREAQLATAEDEIVLSKTADKITVRELAELWLSQYIDANRNLSPATAERYRKVVARISEYRPNPDSVKPDLFGDRTVKSIKASQLKKLLADIPVLNDDGEFINASYMKVTYFVLRHVFAEAVSEDIRVGSPMLFVNAPRIPEKAVKRAARPITAEEYKIVRNLILSQPRHSDYLLPLLDFMALCGLRIGEALALTRRDLFALHDAEPVITLSGHVVTIEGSLVRVDGLKESRGNGIREIVPAPVVAELLHHRLEKMKNLSPDALIFATRNGTLIAPANIRRTLRRLAEHPNAPERMSPHSFRKMVGEVIEVERGDEGISAAGYLGNTPSIAKRHYQSEKIRRTSAEMGSIVAEKLRSAMPERYPAQT